MFFIITIHRKIFMIICKPHEVLKLVVPYLPDNPIIIEAGAFDGTDTKRIAQQWPHATIHAFEPVPELYTVLVHNTAAIGNIHCYGLALSNTQGTASFYISEKPHKPGIPSQAGSLLPPKERLKHSPLQFPYSISVQTTTLDTWAKEYQINHVDFLWLDLQGNELAALKGAQELLSTIKVIYAEVSFIEGYQGQPRYEEVRNWLIEHNFIEIARTFSNQDDWFFGNIVCIKNNNFLFF